MTRKTPMRMRSGDVRQEAIYSDVKNGSGAGGKRVRRFALLVRIRRALLACVG